MRAALALACLTLCACGPKTPEAQDASASGVEIPPFTLDCSKGYANLAAELAATPALTPATAPGEPYLYYNQTGGGPSYVVTQVGAPGHPAVLKQEAVRIDGKKSMMTTGCPYGDRRGYATLLAYLQGLKEAASRPDSGKVITARP